MKKATRPSFFTHEGMPWKIYWLKELDNMGETNTDLCEVKIATTGVPEEVLKETLQHELLHIVLRDIMAVLASTQASPSDIEEAIIRIASPRLFGLYKQNPELREYLYGDKP